VRSGNFIETGSPEHAASFKMTWVNRSSSHHPAKGKDKS
jgi:hypothetical protein